MAGLPFPGITRKAALWLFCVGICLASIPCSGCKKADRSKPLPAPLHRKVLIGIVPEEEIFVEASRYRPLIRYLSRKTGFDVKERVFAKYERVVASLAAKRIDAAFFGSYTYVLAHEQMGAQIIARPERKDGSASYRGLLIVRKDSGIRTIEDMRGKRFVFVDRDTMAGYLLPLVYFRKHGVDYHTWFREAYFAGTHTDAVKDVLNRDADAGAVKSTVLERLAVRDSRVKTDLLVLESSPEVPENGLAVRNDLDAAVRERLTEVLLSMQSDPGGADALRALGALRFIPTSDDDYRPVRDFARKAGIDLRTGKETDGK